MMAFKIIGTGPRFPNGYLVAVNSAAEAQRKLRPMRRLCGSATVWDEGGHELNDVELGLLARRELLLDRGWNSSEGC